jgi:hypothetical protein
VARWYLFALPHQLKEGGPPLRRTPSRHQPSERETRAPERAFFAYCTNYLIDLKRAVIVDVEATTAVRQAEVTAQQRMIDRTQQRFGLWPKRLAADAAYGSAENLAWLVHERGIEPHIPVFDNSQRSDGTYSRDDFAYNHKRDCYICPAGRELRQRQKIYRLPRPFVDENGMMRYRASKLDCDGCSLKPQCCPNAPTRKIQRSIHEGARDLARDIAATEAYATSRRERDRDAVCAFEAHSEARSAAITRAKWVCATNSTSPSPPKTSANWPG